MRNPRGNGYATEVGRVAADAAGLDPALALAKLGFKMIAHPMTRSRVGSDAVRTAADVAGVSPSTVAISAVESAPAGALNSL